MATIAGQMKIVTLLALTLVGCGASESTARSQHVGSRTFAIQCEERADCYQEAGRVCRNGFSVLDSGTESQTNAIRIGRNVYLDENSTVSLLVRCGERGHQ